MRTGYAFLLTALSLSLTQLTRANIFYLKDQWRGDEFYQGWTWETENDPTHGRVNYVGLDEAKSKNLANGTSFSSSPYPFPTRSLFESTTVDTDRLLVYLIVDRNKFIMRADDWSIVNASARGRDSVRISSQTAYDEAVFVLDLEHMPYGCATWPAFWTLSQQGPWPAGGEIDIIEGKHPRALSLPCLFPTHI
jgi:hypothetical protein